MYYYSVAEAHTTSGTPSTETNVFRTTTGSTRECHVTRCLAGAQGAPVDAQVWLKLWRMSTASTSGTAETPKPHDNSHPASSTSMNLAATTGTKETNPALQLAFNSRGQGHWFATNPDEAHTLAAGGGANGNIDLLAEASSASVALRYEYSFTEG